MHWKSVITQYCLWRVNFPFVANFMVPKVIIRIRIDSRITYHLGGVAWQLNVPLLVSLFRTNGEPANTKHLKQPTWSNNHMVCGADACVCCVDVCYFIGVVGNSENRKRQLHPRNTWDIQFLHKLLQGSPAPDISEEFKAKVDGVAINQRKNKKTKRARRVFRRISPKSADWHTKESHTSSLYRLHYSSLREYLRSQSRLPRHTEQMDFSRCCYY